jgi:hypothetical protein
MNVNIEKVVIYFQLVGYMALSALNRNWNIGNRLNVNGNNWNDTDNGHAVGIVLLQRHFDNMKTYNNLYARIISLKNLIHAWKNARKGKTKKDYVKNFEEDLAYNLKVLYDELKSQTYSPKSMQSFILRDPKTRKISKSDFRDRIVHHALVKVIEFIFEKTFIYDNCANRKGKGNLFAIGRFYKFVKIVSENGRTNGWFNENQIKGYCLKADIKHYFQEVDREILLEIIKRKISDEKVIWLIKQILYNKTEIERERDADVWE